MKVLLISEDVPVASLGGAGRHAVVLGNALLDAGHHVEFLGRKSDDPSVGANGFNGQLHRLIDLRGTGWQEHRFGAFLPYRRHHIAKRIWKHACEVGAKDFDVVHYHGHVAELGTIVPAEVNYIHTVHDQGSDCIRFTRFFDGKVCSRKSPEDCAECFPSDRNMFQRKISSIAVEVHRRAAQQSFVRHKVIFVSDFLKRGFLENTGYQGELRARVIHNFIPREGIRRAVQNGVMDNAGPPVIFMAGRIDRSKGFVEFLDCISDDILERYEIRIAGDGPDMERLRRIHGGRRITLLGFLPAEVIYRETSRASGCVVPSLCEEACATTIIEALALGRVVWALDRGGTPELAVYQRFTGQLRLFQNLKELVEDLVSFKLPNGLSGISADGSVEQRLEEIVDFYEEGAR